MANHVRKCASGRPSKMERLMRLFLERPVHSRSDEIELPFGRSRRLPPVRVVAASGGLELLASSAVASRSVRATEVLHFDPSALLFMERSSSGSSAKTAALAAFRGAAIPGSAAMLFSSGGLINGRKLASNANGTAGSDAEHIGAVLGGSCWLASRSAVMEHPSLPPTQNAKLQVLKAVEFLARERGALAALAGGDLAAVVRDETRIYTSDPNVAMVWLRSRSSKGGGQLGVAVFDCKGNKRLAMEQKEHSEAVSLVSREIRFEPGDVVVLYRSTKQLDIDAIGRFVATQTSLIDDLDVLIPTRFSLPDGCKLIASRIAHSRQFDSLMQARLGTTGLGLSHVAHWDSRKDGLVYDPAPGPFGLTSRHSIIYRPSYYAGLHHDASKINRFRPTIDFVLRKLACKSEPGQPRRMAGDVLRRVAEVQYYAHVLLGNGGARSRIACGGGGRVMVIGPIDRKIALYEGNEVEEVVLEPGNWILLASGSVLPMLDVPGTLKACHHSAKEFMTKLVEQSMSFAGAKHDPKMSLALFEVSSALSH